MIQPTAAAIHTNLINTFRCIAIIGVLFIHQEIYAQEKTISLAIDFKNLSFEEAKTLAHQSGKGIFMDVYAVWCIPCKQFEKTVFTDTTVGNKFNSWFVNLKIDAEKGEGKQLAKIYKVGGYPTGIFINAAGDLLSKFEGVLPKATFITYGENALKMMDDPHAYEKALGMYSKNKTDLQGIRNLIQKSLLSGNQIPQEAMDVYFGNCTKQLFRTDSSDLKKWVRTAPAVSAGKTTYTYFVENTSEVKQILNLDDTFLSTFFYNSLQNSIQAAAATKDYTELQKTVKLNEALPILLRQSENIDYTLDYYLETKDFENYFSEMNNYCHSHFDKINSKKLDGKSKSQLAMRINTFGWNYLLYSENKKDLAYAEKLMQTCVELEPNFAAWYDTYAGIIYKLGDTTKAIDTESKAVLLSKNNATEQGIYSSKIERMKRGEKTWLPEQY